MVRGNDSADGFRRAAKFRSILRSFWGVVAQVRYAARSLLRSPGYALAAITTLGLGMGTATAVIALADSLLLNPTPFASSERLVYVRQHSPARCPRCYDLPESSFGYWQEALRGIAEMGALRPWHPVWRGSSATEALSGYEVTAGYFRVLGASLSMGRPLSDSARSGPREVVLADALWKARFGARPDVLGTQMILDGEPHVIVGVLRPNNAYPANAQVFTRLDLAAIQPGPPLGPRFDVFGRLLEDASIEAAQARATSAQWRLAAEFPEEMDTWQVQVSPIRKWRQDATPIIVVLLGAVALILTVACINLTGLLLARFVGLRRELAVRLALGASRARVAAQLAIESVLLSLIGALVGLATASLILAVLTRVIPVDLAAAIPGWPRLGISVRTMVAAVAMGLTVGVVTAVAPVRQIVGRSLAASLGEAARGATAGVRIGGIRKALIISEIALAVVLLVAAGLLVRSVDNMRNEPLGFDMNNVLTMSLQPGWNDQRDRPDYHAALIAAVESVPGVARAATVSALPLSGRSNFVTIDQASETSGADDYSLARLQHVTAGYFEVMGIRLLRGESLDGSGQAGTGSVALVNENAVRRLGNDVVGGTIRFGDADYRVIGVVNNVRHDGVRDVASAEIYVRESRPPDARVTLVVRLADPADLVTPRILEAVRRYEPDLAPADIRTMQTLVATSLAPFHLVSFVLLGLAAFAMLISSVGLYGLIGYLVGQRKREFGIRLALGARPGAVVLLVLRQGIQLTMIGAVLGGIGALGVGRLLQFLLYGVGSQDAMTLLAVVGGVAGVAMLATYLPARAALRANVIESLQSE